jgi:hypothetical protein
VSFLQEHWTLLYFAYLLRSFLFFSSVTAEFLLDCCRLSSRLYYATLVSI